MSVLVFCSDGASSDVSSYEMEQPSLAHVTVADQTNVSGTDYEAAGQAADQPQTSNFVSGTKLADEQNEGAMMLPSGGGNLISWNDDAAPAAGSQHSIHRSNSDSSLLSNNMWLIHRVILCLPRVVL